MAKRKRLTPAQPGYLDPAAPSSTSAPGISAAAALSPSPAPQTPATAPPIAQVSGDAAARAALADLAAELETARAQGLMLERLPLETIEISHLVRDRLVQDEDEMEALMASLEARGQQTPIEVVRLPQPRGGKTHGLISGWRRVTALTQLHARSGDPRFGFARALVIAPESASDAYVAMVEENEIRVNLSFYERARIATRAVAEGVYPDARAALRALYGSTTRSKRSKIGSFMTLVDRLDGVLRHPTAISEKLGLALVKALEAEEGLADRLEALLEQAAPATASEELAILSAAITPKPEAKGGTVPGSATGSVSGSTPPAGKAGDRVSLTAGPGVELSFAADRNRIELSGPGVDAALMADLQDWLRQRGAAG